MSSGGKREGAGRKPYGVVSVSLRLRPDDIEFIRTESKESGETVGETVHRIVERYKK